MISKLAESTVLQWQIEEGLQPTFQDIVLLNGLGLKLENNSDTFNFASVPRVAFLGDFCLWEPTVAKKIWMDCAVQLIEDNFLSHLCFSVFSLNCPDTDLPSLSDTKALKEALTKCQYEIVNNFTETQMIGAIRYVLKGDDASSDCEWNIDKKEKDSFYKLPPKLQSQAKQVLAEALSYGIDEKVKYDVTLDELERMITVATIHSGTDALKSESGQRAGAFYAAAGTIHARLVNEKNAREQKTKTV